MATIRGGTKYQNTLRDMANKLAKPGELRVGYMEGSTYPNGTPVAMVGAIQEFGAPKVGIPPRPAIRNMIAAKSPTWPKAVGENLVATKYDKDRTLRRMGEGIKGQWQQSIIDTNAPPLSPVTLMLRKMKSQDQSLVVTGKTVAEARSRVAAGESTAGVSIKPLVESGHLLNSVDFEVK